MGWELLGWCGYWLRDQKVRLLMQGGLQRDPELKDLPSALDFVRNDADRRVLELFFTQKTVARPVIAPPGIPAERLASLRAAFAALAKDPEFLKVVAESEKEGKLTTQIESVLMTPTDYSPKLVVGQPTEKENAMSLKLPAPVLTYLAAEKAKSPEMLAFCFADDAHVHDEGQDHRGIDAIKAWKKAADAKYTYVLEPLSASVTEKSVILRARLTGNFPGSPVELDHTFTLANDKITSLEIR